VIRSTSFSPIWSAGIGALFTPEPAFAWRRVCFLQYSRACFLLQHGANIGGLEPESLRDLGL